MKTILLVLGIAAICLTTTGQSTFDLLYGGQFPDRGNDIVITEDSYIAIGKSIVYPYETALDSVRLFMVSVSHSGQTLWEQKIEVSPHAEGMAACNTNDGNIVVAGYYRNEIFDDTYAHLFLLKSDYDGQVLWTNKMELFGPEENLYPNNIIQTSDDGLLISGNLKKTGAEFEHLFLIKTTSEGDTLWSRSYGGDFFEHSGFVEQTTDGGYILGGTIYFWDKKSDFYLVKTDEQGDTIWTNTFGSERYDWHSEVHPLDNGEYICVGSTNDSDCGIYLVKVDAYGDTLWTKSYFEEGRSIYGRSVHPNTNGSFVITGWSYDSPHFFLMKVDEYGDIIWERTFGDEKFLGTKLRKTEDDGYIITGSKVQPATAIYDLSIIKTNESGLVGSAEYNYADSDLSLRVFPNPFSSEVNMEIISNEIGPMNIRLYNSIGILIKEYAFKKQVRKQAFKLYGASLPSGLYYLMAQVNACSNTCRIIKLK